MRAVVESTPGVQTVVALEDGALVTGTIQDCTAIAERTKALHNIGFQGPSKDMKLAASIPFVMVDKYLNDNRLTLQEFQRDKAHIRRLLNDPALAHFRVWGGKV